MADSKRKIVVSQIKMHSTKVEPKKYKGMALCGPSVYYPNIYLNTKQAPDLEGKDAGDEVEMVVKGKITSHSINSNSMDGKKSDKRETFDVQISSIGLVK